VQYFKISNVLGYEILNTIIGTIFILMLIILFLTAGNIELQGHINGQ